MDAVSGVLELLLIIAVILVRASIKSGKKEANMRRSARKLNEQKRELTEAMSQKQRERMQTLQQSVQQTSGYQSLKQFAERQMQQYAAHQTQRSADMGQAYANQQMQQSRPQQAPRKQTAGQQSRPQQASRKQAASQAYRTAQKQEAYRTAQEQKAYRAAQEQAAGKQKDILARAAENVRENDVDELEQQDLMGAVENLMIMGYQPELSYQRDFLAEGIEMLNTYTVPDMVPEFTMDNSMPTVG